MFVFENCLCLKNDQILKNYLVYQINKNEFKNLHFKKVLKCQKIFIFYTTSKLKVTRGAGMTDDGSGVPALTPASQHISHSLPAYRGGNNPRPHEHKVPDTRQCLHGHLHVDSQPRKCRCRMAPAMI
jgi:hypothetical protein